MNKQIDQTKIQEKAADERAFTLIIDYIIKSVVNSNGIVKLVDLRNLYISELKKAGHGYSNYRSEKILKRLQNHPISEKIFFTKLNTGKDDAITYWLVCSCNITVSDAISGAFSLRFSDKYQDVALVLRNSILKAFKEKKELPWPRTSAEIEINPETLLPGDLIRFLNLLIAGKEDIHDDKTPGKTRRWIPSIGQDICRAVSDGAWKLPKHILLCMTIRHLYRSKQLTTILNRLGHSESYDFALEVETALAEAIDKTSSYLTPQIVKGESNVVFHSEWDNLNKTTTNVHGTNIVNSAGGIMVQEVKAEYQNSNSRTLALVEKKQKRSQKVSTPETLPPLVFNRIGPKFPDGCTFTTLPEVENSFSEKIQEYYIWLFSRYVGGAGIQTVPGLGGFISATGETPLRRSTIEYYTPIHQPITDNAVVRELLKRSEEATIEVGQKFVINTFDLGVCMYV